MQYFNNFELLIKCIGLCLLIVPTTVFADKEVSKAKSKFENVFLQYFLWNLDFDIC